MNHKKIMAAAVSIAALASLAACGGVKDSGSASGDADVITVGTTDKVTSVDPAGSYDNGSYAVQINVFPFLYAQDYFRLLSAEYGKILTDVQSSTISRIMTVLR